MDPFLDPVQAWLTSTTVSRVMNDIQWVWPINESLHFIGVSLLFGVIALYDLRLIGFLKRMPMDALHRLIPWGISGYCLNVLTGFNFLAARPDQYLHNPAFQTKLLFMTGAGINVAVFYWMTYRWVRETGADRTAPVQARIAGAVSLACWTGVIVCGRLITFYRPPAFFWCFWC